VHIFQICCISSNLMKLPTSLHAEKRSEINDRQRSDAARHARVFATIEQCSLALTMILLSLDFEKLPAEFLMSSHRNLPSLSRNSMTKEEHLKSHNICSKIIFKHSEKTSFDMLTKADEKLALPSTMYSVGPSQYLF
jgi:hypothetical protein